MALFVNSWCLSVYFLFRVSSQTLLYTCGSFKVLSVNADVRYGSLLKVDLSWRSKKIGYKWQIKTGHPDLWCKRSLKYCLRSCKCRCNGCNAKCPSTVHPNNRVCSYTSVLSDVPTLAPKVINRVFPLISSIIIMPLTEVTSSFFRLSVTNKNRTTLNSWIFNIDGDLETCRGQIDCFRNEGRLM